MQNSTIFSKNVLACKIGCNQTKNPSFNHESILSYRSVKNFNDIGFWEIVFTDFKNPVLRKPRLKQKPTHRDPNEREFQKSLS